MSFFSIFTSFPEKKNINGDAKILRCYAFQIQLRQWPPSMTSKVIKKVLQIILILTLTQGGVSFFFSVVFIWYVIVWYGSPILQEITIHS